MSRGGLGGTGAGGPRYLVAVRHPVESLHQVGCPLQQDLLGRERDGAQGGPAPPPQPHLHMGDMQAPCPATSPRPHTGDMTPRWHVPELPCNAQSPSPALPQRTHGAGAHCVPPWPPHGPPFPRLCQGWGANSTEPRTQRELGVRDPGQPAGCTQRRQGGAQGLCVPLPVPWSSGTAGEDPWVEARQCPAPVGDGVSLPAPVGVTEHDRARHPRQTPGGGVPTLGRRSGSPGCRGMTFCSRWNP